MVITGRTRNAFVGQPARGFESHHLRQNKDKVQWTLFLFWLSQRWDSNKEEASAKARSLRRGLKGGEAAGGNPTISVLWNIMANLNPHRAGLPFFLCWSIFLQLAEKIALGDVVHTQ